MGVRRSIDTGLRTLVCLVLFPAAVIVCSLRIIVLALVGAPRPRIDLIYVQFARFCTRIAGTQIEAHGTEHIVPGQAYVIVANHESVLDPVVLMAVLDGLAVRFIVKKLLIRIPIFGQALLASGNVMVERTNTPGDMRRIRGVMSQRDPDVSILFYAEGGRARDGSLRPFKKGAFRTALTEGLPILPVATAGTFPLWTPDTLRIRKGGVVLEVGPPIPVEELSLEAHGPLCEQARNAVRELRASARRRLRELGMDPGGVD